MVLRRAWQWLALSGIVVGCAAPQFESGESEKTSSSHESIVKAQDVLGRAQEWVDKKVPYCGGVRGGGDALCGGTCNRPAAAWDKYRSDCSGFVSWCWQVAEDPSTHVYMHDRGGADGWTTVAIDDLQPGDALVTEEHIQLFAGFIGGGKTQVKIYQESDCGLVANIKTETISRIDGTFFNTNGARYHGIRRSGISAGGGAGAAGTDATSADGTPIAPAEGSQSFLFEGQQHYFARAANGDLAHAFWDPSDSKVHKDVWGQGIQGTPSAFVDGSQQHVFARGAHGSLDHWFWDKSAPDSIAHDTWGDGLASDPSVIQMGGGQHAFATDAAGNLQHWFWTREKGIQHDVWGAGVVGRPSVFSVEPQQHVFVRGKSNALEHFWWSPEKGVAHDTWAQGIASEPAARNINGDQHVFAVDAQGTLQHWFWTAKGQTTTHDTWSGAGEVDPTSRPGLYTHGESQHVLVRGRAGGSVEHYFWYPDAGLQHNTWGQGVSTDLSTLMVGDDEHGFANDASGGIQHWWWSAATTNMNHDTW